MSGLKKKNLLSSWKEIAAYLDCDERTCRRWEKKLNLPVHRIDKESTSRVFAYREELDNWLVRHSGIRQKSEYPNTKKIIWLTSLLSSIFVISLFFILILGKNNQNPLPADFRIESSKLIITNEKNEELWRYDTKIENLCDEKFYKEHFQFKQERMGESRRRVLPRIIIKDLNGDGKKEVLFSIQTQDDFGEGKLICFDHKGNLLWEFSTEREIIFGQKKYSDDFRIYGFDVLDLDTDGFLEIVIISTHVFFEPCQACILDHEGKVLGEYWNYGYLSDFTDIDINNDGINEIIFVGTNNEYGKGCLAAFDSIHINGCSPQSPKFRCEEFETGQEKYYMLFPRTDLDLIENPINSLTSIDVLKNGHITVTTANTIVFFELSDKFEIHDVRFSHQFIRKHKMAQLEGKINSELNRHYEERLAKDVLYYNGRNWVLNPTGVSNRKNRAN